MQIPILNGIYADTAANFRTRYPRNMVPVPKGTGISEGYLRPADGIEQIGTGPGADRGGINWQGQHYRVMGTKLVRVSALGTVTVIGDVTAGGPVTLDYSFDRLGIASGGRLYYCDGGAVTQVTDPDLGTVLDATFIGGYWLTTDGENLVVTELTDPYAVNPLKYGSSEADPDAVVAVDQLRNEAYAFNRHTIEVFQNVGGSNFPFQRIDGAQVTRGLIGTHAYAKFLETFAFLGGGRNEAPAVWLLGAGSTRKLSTREIDQVLATYTEAQLSGVVVETRLDNGHQHLLIHLPDTCWVYDAAASEVVGEPVWFELTTSIVGSGQYRARGLVWVHDHWHVADPVNGRIGRMVDDVSTHYGETIGWDFGTLMLYNDGRGAIVHQLELVALPGRVAIGADPVIWASYSLDGETYSQERPISVGGAGERNKRLVWRRLGHMRNYRIQRFRGTSDARVSVARLEAQLEPLNG
jgi:hypothetical protein